MKGRERERERTIYRIARLETRIGGRVAREGRGKGREVDEDKRKKKFGIY